MKRIFDILFSLIIILCFFPLGLIISILIKLSSSGGIFYSQIRIGKNAKPFKIYKFRSMKIDSDHSQKLTIGMKDPRITSIGFFIRKYKLDEFPQFINVLFGQMSLVGPRPERQFYIDQIVKLEAQYLHLNRVRPGITSWGQVKFGYAENVEQMLQRMKFDLIYLKNRSLALDIKIMFYTVIIVLKAKGK